MKFKLKPIEKKWILYDIGNSAFALLISTIIPIYFNYLAGDAGISEVNYLAYWLYVNATANISVDSEDATLLTLTGAGAYTDLTVSGFKMLYDKDNCLFYGSYEINGPEQAKKTIDFAFRSLNEEPRE